MSDMTPVNKTITLMHDSSPDTPACDIAIPRELGAVQLIREIGRGGMGVVYLGWHGMLHRDVAVKFLLNAVAGTDDPGFKRFLDEGRAAAAVRHPALTVVYDANLIENVPYLVIEYVNGPTLSQVIRQSDYLSLGASLAVLNPVINAISALHAKSIIHRDIKPSNVLLDADARVLVTDFGLACARPQRKKDATKLRLAGTPAYMAPEMFDGTVSSQSDVYALGIMTFELLTGSLPFTGSLEELRKMHLQKPLPLDPLRERHVDSAMIEIVERATHKKEMFRFKRAEHYWRAIRDSVVTDDLLKSGAAELRDSVFKLQEREPTEAPIETTKDPSTSTYFEHLSEMAHEKRTTRTPLDTEVEVGPSQEDRVTSGIKASEQYTGLPLLAEVPCAMCDYNLRGLPADAKCPECGTSVISSLSHDRFIFTDPSSLRKIARGLLLLIVMLTVTPVLLIGSLFLQTPTTSSWGLIPQIMITSVMIAIMVGVFLSTSYRFSFKGGLIERNCRWVARVMSVAFVISEVSYSIPTLRNILLSSKEINHALDGALFFGFALSLLVYLGVLAKHISSRPLVRFTRAMIVSWCLLIVSIYSIIITATITGQWSLIDGVPFLTFMMALFPVYFFFWMLMKDFYKSFKGLIASSVSYDSLFGDVPTEVALAPAEINTKTVSDRAQSSSRTTDGTLQVDISCTRCEYNLRGLSASGRCPECGEPIASSLCPDRLLFAEPSWLRHIMRGLTVLYTGGVVAMPVLFLVGVASSVSLSTGGTAGPALAGVVAGVVLIVGLVLGSFFATAAEPRRYGGSIRWSSRRVARTLGILIPLLFATIPFTANHSRVLLIVSLGLMGAAFLGMIVTFLLYLASLAERIPKARLVRQARGLAIAVGVIHILGAAAGVAAFSLEKTFPMFSWIMYVTVSICLLGSVLSAGLYLGLIRLYRKAIKRVIAASVPFDKLFGEVPTSYPQPAPEHDSAPASGPYKLP